MTCEYVFRDMTDIFSRLFNHRAALHGLTNSFVKEFEEKRGDREFSSLTRSLEQITDCKDRAVTHTTQVLEANGQPLLEAVDEVTNRCKKIQEDDENKKSEWLETERLRRQKDWGEFMTAQVNRSKRIDDEFEQKVTSLQKHYSELEDKLKESVNRVL